MSTLSTGIKPNALVTGATSGLGRALVFELLNHGYDVTVLVRASHRVHQLEQEISQAHKASFHCLKADLAHTTEIERCLTGWDRSIDLLVNCAGVSMTGRVEDIPIEEFERAWKVNFLSPVALIRTAIPRMRQQGGGTIVNISSGVARRALPFAAPYCSAKAALNAFTDSLRVELAATNIAVLLFSPGPVSSRFHDNVVHHGKSKLANPPFRGVPAEIVAAKLYQAIKKGSERKTLGLKAALAHHLHYWSPELTDFIVKKMYRIDKAD